MSGHLTCPHGHSFAPILSTSVTPPLYCPFCAAPLTAAGTPPRPWWKRYAATAGLVVGVVTAVLVTLYVWNDARRHIDAARREAEEQRRQAAESGAEALSLRNREAVATQHARQMETAWEQGRRERDEVRKQAAGMEKALQEAQRQRDANAVAARDATRLNTEVIEQIRQQAERRRQQVAEQLARVYVTAGLRFADEGDPAGALPWLAEALRVARDERLPEEAHRQRLAVVLGHCPRLLQAWFHDGKVGLARLSADGRRALAAAADGTVTVWDTLTGRRIGDPLVTGAAVSHAIFSPDGLRILTAGADGAVRLWDVDRGREVIDPVAHAGPVTGLAFSPDGRRFLTVSRKAMSLSPGGDLHVYDTATGDLVGSEETVPPGDVAQAVFSPDGRHVLLAGLDRTARVWDAAAGKEAGPILRHDGPVNQASFSPDARTILTASDDATARLWDARTGQPSGPPLRHGAAVRQASYSPDGRTILTASDDGVARVWLATTGEPAGAAIRHGGPVSQALFSPDGRHILTAGDDGTARLWGLAGGDKALVTLRQDGPITHTAFSPDGAQILTHGGPVVRLWDLTAGDLPDASGDSEEAGRAWFSADGRRLVRLAGPVAQVYDVGTGKPVGPPLKHRHDISAAAFSDDGRRLLTVTNAGKGEETEGEVRLWDADTGTPVAKPLDHVRPVHQALFSPDGRRVVTVSADQRARVWDAATGDQIGPHLDHEEPLSQALFSPDGRQVLTVTADGTVRGWDATTGQRVGDAFGPNQGVQHLAFSPDGRRLVTAGGDGTARVWDLLTGKPVTPPLRQNAAVQHVTFSPDGRHVATASADRTARVWDAATGQPVTLLLAHRAGVARVAFSPDGRRVATAAVDLVSLWDAVTGESLGPALKHSDDGRTVNHVGFTPEGRLVTAAGTPGDPRVRRTWDLAADTRPVAELLALAGLLAGHRLDATGHLAPSEPGELRTAWGELRPKYPNDFAVSPERLLAWHRRAAAECERQKLWAGAVVHLSRLIEGTPDRWELLTRRGRVRAELKQWDQAEADYRRAVERQPDRGEVWSALGQVLAEARRWEEAVAAFSKAVELRADDRELRQRRGQALAEQGKWKEAAADLNQAIRLGQNDALVWYQSALLTLAAGDTSGYRQACTRMIRRFAKADDPAAARTTAWTCALAADAVSDLAPLLQRMEQAATAEPKAASYRQALAALLYRAGRFEPALRHWQKVMALRGPEGDPRDWLFLAMTHHRLGRADEAKQWLDKAAARLDGPKGDARGPGLSWEERLELRLLRDEVAALVKGAN